jgi:hypothetical protein
MTRLVLEASALLLRLEIAMKAAGLTLLCGIVRKQRCVISGRDSLATLCHAIDLACAFYPKRVLCLQRSAATVLLLRRHGVPAELVIGAQVFPFRSHAWAEVDRSPVGDRPYVSTLYRELERC